MAPVQPLFASRIWLIFCTMSILSTDTTVATSDLSTVYSTDPFGNDGVSVGNLYGGARDISFASLTAPVPIGNVVHALWSLPADLGNLLLEDPPEGVPNDVFLENDVDAAADAVDNSDDDVESVDLLAETPNSPPKKFRTLRSWTYDYKLRAVIDTFYVLKDDVAGQTKYNVPAYQLRRWRDRIEQLDIDRDDFGVGRNFQSSTERKLLRKKKIGNGASGKHLDDAHDKLDEWFQERVKTGAILNRTVLARKLYDIVNPKANPTARELNNYLFRVDRWRKKRGVVNRRVTHVSQKVEKDQSIMDDWVTMVNATIKAHRIQPHCIVSMDETNCYFDQSKKIGSQLAYIGSKEVRRCERVEFLLYVHSHCTCLFYTGKLKECWQYQSLYHQCSCDGYRRVDYPIRHPLWRQPSVRQSVEGNPSCRRGRVSCRPALHGADQRMDG
jgi:hypothetical protein